MKHELVKTLELDVPDDSEGIDCGIDSKSEAFMFDMVSRQLYSNPIPSIVREITSNGFDSHAEAGVDDAVIVRFTQEEGIDFISFIDVGVGLSPERIRNVYSKYFSSTKRDSNDQHGMWGLGSKSPLAYVDAFDVITRFDGTEYHYIVHRGETGRPRIEFVFNTPTTERNGTEVKIQIKQVERGTYYKYTDSEVNLFEAAIESQLCYFDNVYVEGMASYHNEYTIYEFENFKFRDRYQYSQTLHIVLGKVAYPIDWDIIKMESIQLPFGIQFEIGELQVTPNRESLKYDEYTAETIRNKVKLVLDEVKTMYEKQLSKEEYSFGEYLQNYYNNDNPVLWIEKKPVTLYHIKWADLAGFQITGFEGTLPINRNDHGKNPFFDYKVVSRINYQSVLKEFYPENTNVLRAMIGGHKMVYYEGYTEKEKLEYLMEKGLGAYTWFFRRHSKVRGVRAMIKTLKLDLKKLGAKKTLEQINLYRKYIHDFLLSQHINYNATIIPASYIEEKKRKKKEALMAGRVSRKANEEILIHVFNPNKGTFTKEEIAIKNLNWYKNAVIYGNPKDKEYLVGYGTLLGMLPYHYRGAHEVHVIMTAKSNFELFEHRTNFYSLDQVRKGELRTLKKIATACLVEESYSPRPERINSILERLCSPIAQKHTEVKDFTNKFYSGHRFSQLEKEFKDDFMELAKVSGYIDEALVEKANQVNGYFNDLPLLDFLSITADGYSSKLKPGALEAVADYLQAKQKALNLEWLIEEPTTQEKDWTFNLAQSILENVKHNNNL